jgi:hypothetical protein
LSKSVAAGAKVLDDGDVAALFGLEMADDAGSEPARPNATSSPILNLKKHGRKPGKSSQGKSAAEKKVKVKNSQDHGPPRTVSNRDPLRAGAAAEKRKRSRKGGVHDNGFVAAPLAEAPVR